MFRSSFRNLVIACILITVGYNASGQRHDYIKIPYPDTLKRIGLKIEAWSILANYLMAGIEVPLKKNIFFEFNAGVSGLYNSPLQNYNGEEATVYSGFMLGTGIKLPIIYTTAMSMAYLMPEYLFTGFQVKANDYYNGNPINHYSVRSQAFLLNFGFRHVNPRSGFFYDIGVGYGIGYTNNAGYGYNGYSFFMDNSSTSFYTGPEQKISALASTFRGSIGLVLKKKK